MERLSKNANVASTPYAWFDAPGVRAESERCVKIAPTLLRRSTSRLIRATEKPVFGAAVVGSSPVWMFSTPSVNAPALPVSRPPTRIGTSRPAYNPIWRL